ncbi:phytoene desaturase family protein [Thalassoroseus pseudoceratinae]|uniref:phytoene desaturase family protein n=1 Tax=Thalassoroseus pseudoceratinae TaxID=2713176 RepID=UPI00141FAFC0|nr:phytoene desaturase family protein [Thalassoroseus pseudoceratinae]
MESERTVGVIGGGLAGLSAACTLAARGHRVTLFERNEWLGGKAAVLEQDGFRFDMGPTILTIPSVLERVFREAGRDMHEELELVRLDPQWRCFFEDDSVLDLVENVDAMADSIRQFSERPADGDGYQKFLTISERLHNISDRFFFYRSVGGIRDTLNLGETFNSKTLSDLLQLRMGQTVAGVVRSCVKDERVAQMIDHFTQYVGSSPFGSPAVLCGIAHMQTEEGIWYPIGGTRAVPVALEKLARELGVTIHTGTGVQRIRTETRGGTGPKHEVVRGVETDDGEFFPFDAVVSNCDSVRTHSELLEPSPATKRFEKRRKYEPACSGVVLYLGLKERYEHLLHHNFVFSRDADEEFEYIYDKGEPAPDPSCYVCAPAVTEPAVAPSGGEALYVLVHTPYLRPGHDWSRLLPDYRRTILEKLSRTAGMSDLQERIVTEAVLTPQDIHDRYHVLNGAIYGLASHGRFLGAFKPANRSHDIAGLYLAGGAAHPGPGMPMVLMSGWIAADSLDQDHPVNQPATALA